jgi:hypothetical protein
MQTILHTFKKTRSSLTITWTTLQPLAPFRFLFTLYSEFDQEDDSVQEETRRNYVVQDRLHLSLPSFCVSEALRTYCTYSVLLHVFRKLLYVVLR